MTTKNIYIDVETTGLNPKRNGILQIGGLVEIDNEIVDEINLFCKPFDDDVIDDKALDVCNISRDDILTDKFLPPAIAYNELLKIFDVYIDKFNRNDKMHFVGYNCIKFDYPFMRQFWDKNRDRYFGSWFFFPPIDVMLIAAFVYRQQRDKFLNFKLETVAETLDIDIDTNQTHDALYDAKITHAIYQKILTEI